jgi:hypothetical protein
MSDIRHYLNLLEDIEYNLLQEASLEEKLSMLKNKFMDKITKQGYVISRLEQKDKDDIWNALVSGDPTPTKKYLQWMVNKGINDWKTNSKQNWMDDPSKFVPLINKYEKLKNTKKIKPEHAEINKFNSLNDFWSMIDTYEEAQSKKDKKSIGQELIDAGEANVVVDNDKWRIIIPKTEKASCYFGVNTRWCTAATKSENRFDSYNSEGDLYIILLKKENKRWQFFMANDYSEFEFKDELDKEVEDYKKWMSMYPEVFGNYIKLDINKNKIYDNSSLLVFVKNPDKDVQLAAVNQNGYAIKYIENPDKDVQLAAVKRNGNAIKYIENPDKDVQLTAVNKYGYAIYYIKNPDKDVQLAAVKKNGNAISYIKNPDKDVQLVAVNNDGYAIVYIKNPDKDVQLAAVNEDGYAISYIKNPDKDVQLAAVNQNGYAIEYIENPDKDVQLTAVKKNGYAIQFIKNPDKDVIEFVRKK